jgi:peptidoglycan/xylan/chitin deacetylase (PgdA/CDA1 family)
MLIFIIIVAIVIWLSVLFYGSAYMSSQMFVRATTKLDDTSRILLTFDDGPHPIYTPRLLEVLRKHNHKAVFFCIASEAEKYPDIVRQIIAEGHTVGSHTYQHSWKTIFYSTNKYIAELQHAHDVFERIGVNIKLFRPPLGVVNGTIGKACRAMGYKAIGWSIRSFDTRNESRDKVFQRVVNRLKGGSIVLLHDRLPDVDKLTDKILSYYEVYK